MLFFSKTTVTQHGSGGWTSIPARIKNPGSEFPCLQSSEFSKSTAHSCFRPYVKLNKDTFISFFFPINICILKSFVKIYTQILEFLTDEINLNRSQSIFFNICIPQIGIVNGNLCHLFPES